MYTENDRPQIKEGALLNEPASEEPFKSVIGLAKATDLLRREIKSMTEIFTENQKVLVSIKSTIDSFASVMSEIQNQSRRMDVIEGDTDKLLAGLNQLKGESSMVARVMDQASKLQDHLRRIEEERPTPAETARLSNEMTESMNSIKNNSRMITTIAKRIDEVKDDLKQVSSKTDLASSIGSEMEVLKKEIRVLTAKASAMEIDRDDLSSMKREIKNLGKKSAIIADLAPDLSRIKLQVDEVFSATARIDSLNGALDELRSEFQSVNARSEVLRHIPGKLQSLESEINSLVQRADSTAFVGESLRSVETDITEFKSGIYGKTDAIEQQVTSLAEMLRRSEESTSNLHKKTAKIFHELDGIRDVTGRISSDVSQEMMVLLKLSEYQSKIRMGSESRYGTAGDLQSMVHQTAKVVNLFDRLSIESRADTPLPREVCRWAAAQILDCADRWEIRFPETLEIISRGLGIDLMRESISVRQVEDIYGTRAADEIRERLRRS